MNKKGVFYILDLVLSFVIIVVGTLLVLASFTSSPSVTQVQLLAAGIINQVSTISLDNINVPALQDKRTTGLLGPNDERKTLMQYVIELDSGGEDDAQLIIHQFISQQIADEYDIEIRYTNLANSITESIYQRIDGTSYDKHSATTPMMRTDPALTALQADTNFIIKEKTILYGSQNDATMFGPYTVEVTLW